MIKAMLEEALTEHDAEGVYYDLLLFLLGAILRTHLEEEEEEGEIATGKGFNTMT